MKEIEKMLQGKNVLIMGGAGFIGSSMAHAFLTAGAKVTVLDAMLPLYGGNEFNIADIRGDIEFIKGDIRDEELIRKLVPGKDIIYNLAAQVSYLDSKNEPFLDLDINARGHLVVLEAVRTLSPQTKVIFSSSRMVYGKITKNPVDESHPTEPLSPYAIHKLTAEKYYKYYAGVFGIHTVIARLPNPYGPRQLMKHSKYSVIGWFVRQALEGEKITIFGDGLQERDYLYIDDIVDAFLRLAVSGKSGEVYNLGTPEQINLVGAIDVILEEVGNGSKEHVPWPNQYAQTESGSYNANYEKLRQDTGWEPKTLFRDGVKKMVAYYRKNKEYYVRESSRAISPFVVFENEVREYFSRRFPRASFPEKEKLVNDWKHKLDQGRGIVRDFRNRIEDPRALKILDAGSGMGGISIAFAEAGALVVGIEIEEELAAIARSMSRSYDVSPLFIVYDGKKMPLVDATFDNVVSVSVLEHVSDTGAFFREIGRILKPGGAFYLAFPNRLWPKETHTGLWGITYLPRPLAAWVIAFFKKSPMEDNNLHFYTYWDLQNMLKGTGLKLRQERGESNNIVKVMIKNFLGSLGIPYKAFLPHISVILEKK